MPKIEQTIADVNVRSHTFRFIPPAMTDALKMPNPCTTCHADKTAGVGGGRAAQRGRSFRPGASRIDAGRPDPLSSCYVLSRRDLVRLLQTAVLCLMAASMASATTMNYDISINFNFGPLNGETDSGTLSFDDSSVQHVGGFNFVAPNGLGLLSLQFTAAGHTINMSDAGELPDDADSLPGREQYSCCSLDGLGKHDRDGRRGFTGGGRGFDYYTVADTVTSTRIANGSVQQGASFGSGNVQSSGTITLQQSGVPEPSTWVLSLAGATLLGLWRFRNRTV